MDIILPVAGLGSRLRPQTWNKPKPLVSLAGKPILEHVIDRVMPLRPNRLVFITGYLGDQIEEWATRRYDMPLAFVEQPVMRGQSDAILKTREIVTGDALILFPDMLFETDWSVIGETDADAVMFTKEVEDPSALGVAVVEEGRITRLVEKPREPISNLAVIGIYYVREMPRLFAAMDEQLRRRIALKNEYFIADALQIMIDEGAKVVAAPVTEWEDCGTVETLIASNRWALDRMAPQNRQRPGSIVVEPSVIAEDAIVERAIIGPYASIASGAVVRDAIVRDAILESNANVAGALVERSVIGRRAKVRGQANSLNIGDDGAVEL
ncbi:MAG: NTP transferase domain-containing protein [Thermomicrobiales bacterium]|nr:NTP transferase domain-containing protein [Thermomicrobiales bacterium]